MFHSALNVICNKKTKKFQCEIWNLFFYYFHAVELILTSGTRPVLSSFNRDWIDSTLLGVHSFSIIFLSATFSRFQIFFQFYINKKAKTSQTVAFLRGRNNIEFVNNLRIAHFGQHFGPKLTIKVVLKNETFVKSSELIELISSQGHAQLLAFGVDIGQDLLDFRAITFSKRVTKKEVRCRQNTWNMSNSMLFSRDRAISSAGPG